MLTAYVSLLSSSRDTSNSPSLRSCSGLSFAQSFACNMAAEQHLHFLLIPFSEHGHINPMLSLASHLLRLHCRVTLVTADRHLPTPSRDSGANGESKLPSPKSEPLHAVPQSVDCEQPAHAKLRFITLPVQNKSLCVDLKTMTRQEIFKKTLAGLEDRQDLFEGIVEQSKASSEPVTGIICDFILTKWVQHIARLHCLRFAVLCSCNALVFYAFYLQSLGKEEERDQLLVSQFGMPSAEDGTAYVGLGTFRDSLEMRKQKKKVVSSLWEGIGKGSVILINSFEALEAPVLPSLRASGLDVKFIGPCLPEGGHKGDASMGGRMANQAEDAFIEDMTCLTWLDQQEARSVLFVSFGSEGEIEEKQVKEIEVGIENSGYKFLWVLRSNESMGGRPCRGLCEQSNGQGKGLVVSWAPQTRVLQHHAVGGFLTHSGWNSTLESLTFGVPMLCLPILADQPYNAIFVQNYLQVGIHLCVSKDGLVHREEVASGVKTIMQGHFYDKVTQIQELAQSAIQVAHLNLTSFVQRME